MKPLPLPPKEILDQVLNVNFETGQLFWKERNLKKNLLEVSWNKKFASKEAFLRIGLRQYKTATLFGRQVYAHRVIYKMYYGVDANYVDHINGDKLDNRILNLRSVTHQENHRNNSLRKDNTSGIVGVYFDKSKNRWVAAIKIQGKSKYLCSVKTLDEAIKIRKEAELKYGFHENHGRI